MPRLSEAIYDNNNSNNNDNALPEDLSFVLVLFHRLDSHFVAVFLHCFVVFHCCMGPYSHVGDNSRAWVHAHMLGTTVVHGAMLTCWGQQSCMEPWSHVGDNSRAWYHAYMLGTTVVHELIFTDHIYTEWNLLVSLSENLKKL